MCYYYYYYYYCYLHHHHTYLPLSASLSSSSTCDHYHLLSPCQTNAPSPRILSTMAVTSFCGPNLMVKDVVCSKCYPCAIVVEQQRSPLLVMVVPTTGVARRVGISVISKIGMAHLNVVVVVSQRHHLKNELIRVVVVVVVVVVVIPSPPPREADTAKGGRTLVMMMTMMIDRLGGGEGNRGVYSSLFFGLASSANNIFITTLW